MTIKIAAALPKESADALNGFIGSGLERKLLDNPSQSVYAIFKMTLGKALNKFDGGDRTESNVTLEIEAVELLPTDDGAKQMAELHGDRTGIQTMGV